MPVWKETALVIGNLVIRIALGIAIIIAGIAAAVVFGNITHPNQQVDNTRCGFRPPDAEVLLWDEANQDFRCIRLSEVRNGYFVGDTEVDDE